MLSKSSEDQLKVKLHVILASSTKSIIMVSGWFSQIWSNITNTFSVIKFRPYIGGGSRNLRSSKSDSRGSGHT